ncbi:DUF599 domain-containing protein [Arenibacterium sp. CAU 1754]
MTLLPPFSIFSTWDVAAVAVLVFGWLWIGWRIEHPSARRPSVSILMESFRRDWMKNMVTREPRIFDAQLVGNLRQSTAFFASASMIAIGGGLALIGNTDQLAGLAQDLMLADAPAMYWEIKLLLVLLFLTNAFLKYVWANRLFGYCSVLMAAVPNAVDAPLTYPRAAQSAELNITAARSFNRGMRSTYFSLAATAWLLGALPLMGAALITVAVLWRREFASQSRTILLQTPPDTDS